MPDTPNPDKKVRGLCIVCGKGVHLWERYASPHGNGDKPIETGWSHDKDDEKADHKAQPSSDSNAG